MTILEGLPVTHCYRYNPEKAATSPHYVNAQLATLTSVY